MGRRINNFCGGGGGGDCQRRLAKVRKFALTTRLTYRAHRFDRMAALESVSASDCWPFAANKTNERPPSDSDDAESSTRPLLLLLPLRQRFACREVGEALDINRLARELLNSKAKLGLAKGEMIFTPVVFVVHCFIARPMLAGR